MAEVEPGGCLIYDSTWPRSALLDREDITIIGVPLSKMCNENFDGARARILMKNIAYVGVIAALQGCSDQGPQPPSLSGFDSGTSAIEPGSTTASCTLSGRSSGTIPYSKVASAGSTVAPSNATSAPTSGPRTRCRVLT